MKQAKSKTKSAIYWDVRSPKSLSEASRLERVLNYGDWDETQKIVKSLGVKKAAAIFNRQIKQKRSNYRPLIANYFKLYFNKNA